MKQEYSTHMDPPAASIASQTSLLAGISIVLSSIQRVSLICCSDNFPDLRAERTEFEEEVYTLRTWEEAGIML